jgi:hypothetical protein
MTQGLFFRVGRCEEGAGSEVPCLANNRRELQCGGPLGTNLEQDTD